MVCFLENGIGTLPQKTAVQSNPPIGKKSISDFSGLFSKVVFQKKVKKNEIHKSFPENENHIQFRFQEKIFEKPETQPNKSIFG